MLVERTKEGFVDMEVSPKLNEFLETVFMKMPSLSFVAHDYSQHLVKCSKYDDKANLIEDSEWMQFINCVRVYNGIEEVGFIRVSDEVYRSNTKETVYQIRSDKHRLNNGRNDTKKTKDVKEALKRCLKVFVTSPEANMVHKCYENVSGETSNMMYWSSRALNKVLDDSGLEIIEYFRRTKNGEQDIEIPKAISNELDKESVLKDLDTAKLAVSINESLCKKDGLLVGDVGTLQFFGSLITSSHVGNVSATSTYASKSLAVASPIVPVKPASKALRLISWRFHKMLLPR